MKKKSLLGRSFEKYLQPRPKNISSGGNLRLNSPYKNNKNKLKK